MPFCDRWGRAFPNAVKAMREDREALTAYLRFPIEHHKRIRHSNFIERTFGETRRRVKVIGRFPGETSYVSLVFAVLDRAATGWRGFTMTATGLRLLQDLRRSLLEPPVQLRPRHAATPASVTPTTDAAQDHRTAPTSSSRLHRSENATCRVRSVFRGGAWSIAWFVVMVFPLTVAVIAA